MELYLPKRKPKDVFCSKWETWDPFRGVTNALFGGEVYIRAFYEKYALPIIGENLAILSVKTPIYGAKYIYTTNDIYGGVELDNYIGTLYIIGPWMNNDKKSIEIIKKFSNYKDFLDCKSYRFNIGYMTAFKNILEDEKSFNNTTCDTKIL